MIEKRDILKGKKVFLKALYPTRHQGKNFCLFGRNCGCLLTYRKSGSLRRVAVFLLFHIVEGVCEVDKILD